MLSPGIDQDGNGHRGLRDGMKAMVTSCPYLQLSIQLMESGSSWVKSLPHVLAQDIDLRVAG